MFAYTKLMQAMVAAGVVSATDPYFNLVTLLLPGNGTNGAQNNTFLDSSTNNFTITRNGNTTQGTFSPFSQTGWSNYFPGTSSDFEEVSLSSIANYAGDLTIECWFSLAGTPTGTAFNTSYYLVGAGSLNANPGLDFAVGDTAIWFNQADYGSRTLSGTWTPNRNWNHIAVTRSGNSWTMWLNGVSIATATSSTAVTSTVGTAAIGRCEPTGGEASGSMLGYISNLRVTKNCVYTSSFTPPTAALTKNSGGQNPPSAAQTVALICQSNRFIDNSDNALTVSTKGSVSVQAFSPFAPTAAYSAATNGGSGYSDGSGDYLTVATNANLTLGSSDFTIELWWYPLAFNSDGEIFTMGSTGGTNRCYAMYSSGSNGTLAAFAGTGSTTWDIVSNLSMGTAIKNAWNHMAFTRSGSTFSTYLNGVRIATTTATGTLGSNALGIFANNSGTSQAPNSYIGGARTIKGTALYTGATYTVPTTPFTAVTNTNFLANFTNAGITDATAKNVLETVGNAQISTTQSKFGGSSISFDGNGDYLTRSGMTGAMPDGQGYAFTLEFWLYINSLPAVGTSQSILSGPSSGMFELRFNGSGTIILANKGVVDILSASSNLSTGTWTYIALTRTAANLYTLYINGSSVASATYNTSLTAPTTIGSSGTADYLNGYIDDFRVTKGLVRSISTPTAAFPVQ